MHLVYIALFGALGCLSRYWVAECTYFLLGRAFPHGTLVVNLLGSLLLGFLMEWTLRGPLLIPELRLGLGVGFMGGFTTFSTFSYETWMLIEEGSLMQAGVNILLNVMICVLFAGLGIWLARQV